MDTSGIECLIFDLDYTLIDSSDGIVYCFNEARRRTGEPEVEDGLLKARIGLPIEEGFKLFKSADPAAMRDLFRKIAGEGAMRKRSFLLPGVMQTIPRLKQRGYRLGVNSTKSRPEIVSILEHLEVAGYFEEFVGSDEVENPKPAPDSLVLAMRRMKVEPINTVYVGDHVVDIRAARAAGVRVVAVAGGPCPIEDIKKEFPDSLVDTVGDLLAMLPQKAAGR